jgi:NodT family efflux transporter outer membrane factor (OMF) lipoprotein
MKPIYSRLLIVMAAVIIAMPSCKVTRPYQQPITHADSLYRGVDGGDSSSIANIPYTKMFNDANLQALIQEAVNGNYDLAIALARIKQAEANLRQSKAAFLPSVSIEPEYTQQKIAASQGGSLGIFPSHYYEVLGTASWEADVWGKLKSAKKAAIASLLQSEAYKRSVQTQLVSEVATDYYNLLAYDKELTITLQTIENRKADVETNKALEQANYKSATEAAVAQSEANRYAAEVTIPDLKNNIRQTENALCVLLGRKPGAIVRDSLGMQQIDTTLKTGLPAQLLANRPDVQQAEYNLRYYFEKTNLARAYFYPSLTITAQGGWQSSTIKDLFSASSLFGNALAGLTQPIFNQGLNKQRLAIAQAQYEEYVATFQQKVLQAGQEVSDALYSYRSATDKTSIRKLQLNASKRAVDYNRELLKNGYATYTDVLTSEQNYLSAQLNSINDNLQQLTAIVSLYRSLGGGWK